MLVKETWSARPERDRLRREWDGEAVIYDPLAGDTHYLDSIAAVVLDHLRAKPASAETLARLLGPGFEADSEADVLAAVQEALAKLRQMDLIRPADG